MTSLMDLGLREWPPPQFYRLTWWHIAFRCGCGGEYDTLHGHLALPRRCPTHTPIIGAYR